MFEIRSRKSVRDSTTRNWGSARNAATTPGESAPPKMTKEVASDRAFFMTFAMMAPAPNMRPGITSVGMTIIEMSVRRSRRESFSSLR